MSTPGEDKAALRRALLARRAGLSARARAATEQAAVEALGGGDEPTVACYLSFGSEPGTGPLLDALRDREVLLPVLRDDGDLDWARAGSGLVTGRLGLREPAGPRLGVDAVATCELVVVPALAVDRAGRRLGRGGGSYDRALARARGRVVALLHDGELVDALPHEGHDQPVHAAVVGAGGLVHLTP